MQTKLFCLKKKVSNITCLTKLKKNELVSHIIQIN